MYRTWLIPREKDMILWSQLCLCFQLLCEAVYLKLISLVKKAVWLVLGNNIQLFNFLIKVVLPSLQTFVDKYIKHVR